MVGGKLRHGTGAGVEAVACHVNEIPLNVRNCSLLQSIAECRTQG